MHGLLINYVRMILNNNFLQHHGIKGQKWGIRNGPPYPIEDKVLKKGTRLNSVSMYKNGDYYKNKAGWLYTYNPNDPWDSKVYEGPFSIFKIRETGAYMNRHTFEVVKDLKLATSNERFDEFINVYKSDIKKSSKEMKQVKKSLIAQNIRIINPNTMNVNLKNPKTKEDYQAIYEIFNHAMEMSDYFETTKRYKKVMESKFDGMVDDNNVVKYNEAHDPVIIFNPSETLKSLSSVRIPVDEISKNYKEVEKTLAKKGKTVAL